MADSKTEEREALEAADIARGDAERTAREANRSAIMRREGAEGGLIQGGPGSGMAYSGPQAEEKYEQRPGIDAHDPGEEPLDGSLKTSGEGPGAPLDRAEPEAEAEGRETAAADDGTDDEKRESPASKKSTTRKSPARKSTARKSTARK